ncbi:hypothetical protein GCM10009546_66140 [Actinomadura livida]|uniref:Adenylyltransferase AadA C-terminal domain-containing protein n=1 Tax=Actinomadura livida TaxID=79909 RepID=A0ABN1FP17_9ACTN
MPGAESCPDLAVLITMVLMGGSSVFGPAAGEVLEPVPREDLRAALLDGVPGLLGEVETDTRNVLLTFARIWSTLVTGRIWSKDEAASWALARLPVEHRAVLVRARSIYLGLEDERWDDLQDAVWEHVGYVRRQIQAVSGSGVGYSG